MRISSFRVASYALDSPPIWVSSCAGFGLWISLAARSAHPRASVKPVLSALRLLSSRALCICHQCVAKSHVVDGSRMGLVNADVIPHGANGLRDVDGLCLHFSAPLFAVLNC